MSPARIITAAALASVATFAASSAEAGCCGWGCCNSNPVAYAQPQVYYAQPAPIVVRVTPPPVYVQVGQPQVIVQQAAYESAAPMFMVNQGPAYTGPGADYSVPYYQPAQPIAPYPYYRSYRYPRYGAPHRMYRRDWQHRSYRLSKRHHPIVYK